MGKFFGNVFDFRDRLVTVVGRHYGATMTTNIKWTRRWRAFEKGIRELSQYRVRVGVFSDSKTENPHEIPLWKLAEIHEFGLDIPVTPKMRGFLFSRFGVRVRKDFLHIPGRSFLRRPFDEHQRSLQDFMINEAVQVTQGRRTAKYAANRIGEYLRKIIHNAILEGIPPPLNPAFQDRDHPPLLDSGALFNAIEVRVHKPRD